MFVLSFHDMLGTLYIAEGTGYQYKFELGQKEFDLILSQLDLMTKQIADGVVGVYDNDDDESNQVLGVYANGILNTDVKINDYIDLRVLKKLVSEQTHLKRNGSLDLRRLLGKATKKYQSQLVAQGTYSSPVAGDEAGSPTKPDSSEN